MLSPNQNATLDSIAQRSYDSLRETITESDPRIQLAKANFAHNAYMGFRVAVCVIGNFEGGYAEVNRKSEAATDLDTYILEFIFGLYSANRLKEASTYKLGNSTSTGQSPFDNLELDTSKVLDDIFNKEYTYTQVSEMAHSLAFAGKYEEILKIMEQVRETRKKQAS